MTRDEAVAIYGPITTSWDCHPHPSERWQAYLENELDYEMPPWARAFGETEAEAIANLLEQAAEHHGEGGDNGESREWMSGANLLGRNV